MQYNANAASKKPGEVYCIMAVHKLVEDNAAHYLLAVLQGVLNSKLHDDTRYYSTFGINALVPAAIATVITRPDQITAFLNSHHLDDTEAHVRQIMALPDHKGESFKSLFAKSVVVLMKQFAGQPVRSISKQPSIGEKL